MILAVRELLSAYAHVAWSGWMQYMFSKGQLHPDGSVTIPSELVQRWTRQANTLYADLPEGEKKSDREEADKIMKVIEEKYYPRKENKHAT